MCTYSHHINIFTNILFYLSFKSLEFYNFLAFSADSLHIWTFTKKKVKWSNTPPPHTHTHPPPTIKAQEIKANYPGLWTSLIAQRVKNLSAMQETQVWSLGWEDLLEKGMANYSSILGQKIPQTEESGRLQSIGLQRIKH